MGYSQHLKLSDDLKALCPTLFSESGAIVVSECTYPQPFGNAWVQLRIDNLFFQFVSDRDLPRVDVFLSKRGWYYLWAFVSQRDDEIGFPHLFASEIQSQFPVPQSWPEWCDFLSQHYASVKKRLESGSL